MPDSIKKLALLTSGGDCAGLNAVIRAVMLRATGLGWSATGIHQGSHGLISRPPSAQDRLIAAAFGTHAVELIAAGKSDRMVAWSNRRVIDVPLGEAIANNAQVDPQGSLIATARGLGICLGDEAIH